MKKLVLENKENKVSRVFHWDGATAHIICREDNRRMELHSDADLKRLRNNKIYFKTLGQVDPQEIQTKPLNIDNYMHLRLVDKIEAVADNVEVSEDNYKTLYVVALIVFLLSGVFMGVLKNSEPDLVAQKEELKQQIVKIIKKRPPQPKKQVMVRRNQATVRRTSTKKRFKSIKRLGALAVLGSSKTSKQKGGLNLGAVNTSAGPGLGGSAGSGGVQKSIYAKGITSAPLGAGRNMSGGGGYGTKGKGGGKAGYGKLSLTGSAGNMPIPLGREAIIQGGLDMDLVSAVIRKNMGQIRFCYEQGLQLSPGIAGRVGVNFVIGGNGQVKVANIGSTTLNSKQIESCVLSRLRSWKFPLPDGGVDVKVAYPFAFRRTGNG